MGALNESVVLDALIRGTNERIKRGETETRVNFTMLLDRIILENDQVNETSARPQFSRHLKSLLRDGNISREKIGRNVFYGVTAKGRFFHVSNRDLLDHTREWIEDAYDGLYFSFAITPPEFGLIHERRNHSKGIEGKEILAKAIKLVKEKNPELDSIHIRIGEKHSSKK